MNQRLGALILAVPLVGLLESGPLSAQERRAESQPLRPQIGPPPLAVVSPEVADDRTVTFRIRAPRALAVRVVSFDMRGVGPRGAELQQGNDGVWHVTIGPLDPGAYRYNFSVDGVSVVDPANPSTSESNANSWSLVYVPGAEYSDTRDVPHGALAEITYYSKSLQRYRRMHVYTPPGYESGEGTFPVLYLLHGALDSDDSWSTVGRAGFILDNLIADEKAVPMVVVMPDGHVSRFPFGDDLETRQFDEFARDFMKDIRPHVERTYRVRDGRAHRAIAGWSMGGMQTLNIMAAQGADYAYVGVFGSGVYGIRGGPYNPYPPTWEERHQAALNDPELKEGLKLVWFASGKRDFLLELSRNTVELLKRHGFDVEFHETDGGHTWANWRAYLRDFVPRLFQ